MRRTLGVVFQDFRLIDKKTVWQNLEFLCSHFIVVHQIGASQKVEAFSDDVQKLIDDQPQ